MVSGRHDGLARCPGSVRCSSSATSSSNALALERAGPNSLARQLLRRSRLRPTKWLCTSSLSSRGSRPCLFYFALFGPSTSNMALHQARVVSAATQSALRLTAIRLSASCLGCRTDVRARRPPACAPRMAVNHTRSMWSALTTWSRRNAIVEAKQLLAPNAIAVRWKEVLRKQFRHCRRGRNRVL
jgi:hypothetical protein